MTAQKPAYQGQIESLGLRISDEELEKLQEIHELINLLFRQLPITAQQAAGPTRMPALPAVPYTYSFFGFPWG
ncbi:MAG TPA: hypothetical protein VNO14_05115 [Blastocatellia bacterium]|nr:hypothetical protein [Blastocatellia bacterium]